MTTVQILAAAFILLATGWGFALLRGAAAVLDWLSKRFSRS